MGAEQTSEKVLGLLTRDDLKALRSSDSICLDHDEPGKGAIRCIKREGAPWYSSREHSIACGSFLRLYGEGEQTDDCRKRARCCAHVSGSKYAEHTHTWTALSFLRAGDVVSLEFVGGDHNQYIKSARTGEGLEYTPPGEKLYHDVAYLRVKRGKRVLVFFMAWSICPNNTARMIRY